LQLPARDAGRGWEIRAVRGIDAEGVREEEHEAPDRHHDSESDDPPKRELASLLALLLVSAARDEVLEDAPDEYHEGDGEDQRDYDPVYDTEDLDQDGDECRLHGGSAR